MKPHKSSRQAISRSSERVFLGDLMSDKTGLVDRKRDAVVAGRERHSSSRYHSLSYPQRAIRTDRFLYIRNLRPHRWPAGTPQKYGQVKFDEDGKISNARLGPEHGGYHDIDACPTLSFLIANRDNESLSKYLGWSVDKRPAEELFDIASDADCIVNLAANPKYEDQRRETFLAADEDSQGDGRRASDRRRRRLGNLSAGERLKMVSRTVLASGKKPTRHLNKTGWRKSGDHDSDNRWKPTANPSSRLVPRQL